MTSAMETALPATDAIRLVRAVAQAIVAHADELTRLDQAIGDGDHGINMKRGCEAVLAEAAQLEGKNLGDVLKAAGMKLVMSVGGASGPLYGTLVMELGKRVTPAPGRQELAAALAGAIDAMKARGKSDVGQKTMLDVWVPVQAQIASGATAASIKAAAFAAAEATRDVRAIRGRASFLGDRSIGHVDPGARSSALAIAALCDALGE